MQVKSLFTKRVNSILVNLRYLRFKLLKYKENNKKVCNTFDHNFKNIPLYIMRKITRKVLFCIIRWYTLILEKFLIMALNSFCDKTLQVQNKHRDSFIRNGSQSTTSPPLTKFPGAAPLGKGIIKAFLYSGLG